MTKTITMTYLLKNPKKVRDFVQQGIELLVQFEGKIVMKIVIPVSQDKGLTPPILTNKSKLKANQTFSRSDIYSGKYDS